MLTLKDFTVESGETLDFEASIGTKWDSAQDSMWLRLYQDGWEVARSIDDGDKGRDNSVMSLFYKAKMTGRSNFHLMAQTGGIWKQVDVN
jgi:hypothetical protein